MKPIHALPIVSFLALAPALPAQAQSQTLTVQGSGCTIVIHFNAGYTSARATALERAAQVWADTVRSAVPIDVDVSFQPLSCTTNSAVLGSAGATTGARDFPNAPASNTWYPIALANALSGADRNGSNSEISASFNSAIDDPAQDATCLTGVDWYYGTGAPPSGTIGFYDVVLHELAHGLGFFSYANVNSGALLLGRDDHYTRLLEDNSTGKTLDASTANDSERATAFADDGDLIWTGSEVNGLSGNLTAGTLNNSEVLMYAPGTVRAGSSVSHFDLRLAPNELMEPSYSNQPDRDLTVALFRDIGWDAPNTAPVVTGLTAPLSTAEDTPIQLDLGDFTVTDPDNVYPTDFTLKVQTASNFSVSGTTVTPATNYDGDIYVPIAVNDGFDDSPTFTATIAVTPVNDAPQVTGSSALTVDEDQDLVLGLSDFEVSDPDDTYPTGFSFRLGAGANYTVVNDDTVRPAPNFNGVLSVPLIVNDSELDSPIFILTVTVDAVNDPPVIQAQDPLQIDEDQALNLTPSNFTITDVEDSTFTVRALAGPNHSATGATVTPAPNFFGTLIVPVAASDGTDEGETFDVTVTVNPVNDAPVVSGQATLSTPEDTPLSLSLADLTVVDPDDTQFTLRLGAGSNYSLAGNVVTPDRDFEGVLSVPVTVNDGEADSDPFVLQVQVLPINDRPLLTGGPTSLRTNEDESIALSLSSFTVTDPDDTFPSDFVLQVDPGDDYEASGAVVAPAPDFFGTLEVSVRVSDGDALSDPLTVQVQVDPVNDAPVISGPEALEVDEDGELELTLSLLDVDDVDDEESDLRLRVQAGPNYTVNGTTVRPDPNFDGSLTVPVVVSDGDAESQPFELEMAVRPIPDRPEVTGQRPLVTLEDMPFVLRLADFIVDDPDSSDLALQVIEGPNFTVSSSTVTPSPDFDGVLEVPVIVSDGALESEPFLARVDVTPVNDPPQIVGQQVVSGAADRDLTLTVEMLQIEDPDDRMFDLQVLDGTGYARTGRTIRPVETGLLTVPVTVSDGEFTSEPFPLQVSVGRAELAVPIVVDASGLYTRLEDPAVPDRLGVLDGPVTVELAGGPTGWVRPGRYARIWRERSGDREALVSQPLWVRPIVSLTPDRRVREGAPGRFGVVLNGPNPEDAMVPYAVAGSASAQDHDLSPAELPLVRGDVLREVDFTTVADGTPEGDEDIQITLAADLNLRVGAQHRTILSEEPVAPDFELVAEVAGVPSTTVVRGGPPIDLQVLPLDGTVPSVVWTFPEGLRAEGEGLRRTLAAEGPTGVWTVQVRAESADGTAITGRVDLKVVQSAPSLDGSADADGDGVPDADEGFGDDDLDGLPNHLDAWLIPHALPMVLTDAPMPVVESDPGVRLRLGPLALEASADGAGLTESDLRESRQIEPDDRTSMGWVDVRADGLDPGQVVHFVLVLPQGLAEDEQVRLHDGSGWRDLADDAEPLASAPGEDGTCPPPYAPSYGAPSSGHRCLRIPIADGGPNDRDGQADRTVRLLVGVGQSGPDVDPGPGGGPTARDELARGTSGGCRCGPTTGPSWSAALLLGLIALGLRTHRSAPARVRRRRWK